MQCEMNIVAMAKNGERYVFLYDDESIETLYEVFGRFADNPELNFTSGDRETLSRKVKESNFTSHESSQG